MNSTEHGLKQCSVRLERLPVELTAGSDLQSHGNSCEKQCSDWIAGQHQVLGENIQYKDSPTLQGQSMGNNREVIQNYYCTKMEGNVENPSKANHSSEELFKCIYYSYSTNNCDSSNMHVQSEHTSEKIFKCNECIYSTSEASDLKKHVQVNHTFERSFKCNEHNYSTTVTENYTLPASFNGKLTIKGCVVHIEVDIKSYAQLKVWLKQFSGNNFVAWRFAWMSNKNVEDTVYKYKCHHANFGQKGIRTTNTQ